MVALNDTSWLSNWATNLGMIEKKKQNTKTLDSKLYALSK